MKSIKLFKNTDCNITLYVYDNLMDKNPVDISIYKDIKFNILEYDKSLLIQKSISSNSLSTSLGNAPFPYIITVQIKSIDTANIFSNDETEEILRYYYLIGIANDGSVCELDRGLIYFDENYVY